MQEYLIQLSNDLIYDFKEIDGNTMIIHCHIKRNLDHKVHSYFTRKINDINYGDYKVILMIKCYNLSFTLIMLQRLYITEISKKRSFLCIFKHKITSFLFLFFY